MSSQTSPHLAQATPAESARARRRLAPDTARVLPVLAFLLLDYLAYLSRRLGGTLLTVCLHPVALVAATFAMLFAPSGRGIGSDISFELFPDLVGDLVDVTVFDCCFFGPLWLLAVCVGLLDLSARMWHLAGVNR